MINLLSIIIILAISFLCEAGLVWLLCWALNLIGVFTIGPVAITFSWPLALAVWVITFVLKTIFSKNKG